MSERTWRNAGALLIVWLLFELAISGLATCQSAYEQAANFGGEDHCTLFIGPISTVSYWAGGYLSHFLREYEHELVAGFTIVLAISTILLWLSTRALWKAGEAELEHLKQSATEARRAWLQIDHFELRADTLFQEDGCWLSTQTTIKNLGITPAYNASLEVLVWIDKSRITYGDFVRDFKNKLVRRGKNIPLGHIVFPNDTLIEGLSFAVPYKDFIRERESDGQKFIDFAVLVGVSYKVVGDDEPRITYHHYDLLNVPVPTQVATNRTIQQNAFLPGEAT